MNPGGVLGLAAVASGRSASVAAPASDQPPTAAAG
jgi:hypothetical protein